MEDRPDTSIAAADRRLAALFPEEHGVRRRRRGALVAVAAVVVAVVVTLVATDAFGSSAPGYRTGRVARRTVEAAVHGVGTIEPVAQARVAFPVAGTVASVAVTVGQPVVVGQTLATLDGQSLQTSLHEKQLALAQAELNLTNARNGTTIGPASTGSGGAGSIRASTTAKVTGAPAIVLTAAPIGGSGSTAAAQQAVLDAQQQVDAVLGAAATAQRSAQTTCAAAGVTVPGSPTPPTSSTTSTSTTTTPSGAALAACQASLANLMHAQQTVSDAQRTLTRAEHELDALLAQAAGTSGSTFGGGTSSSGSSSGRTATATGPSAADLASYQRAVDSAVAAVAVAQQAVQQGTIVSPIAGTVTAVDLTAGLAVSAASTTDAVIVTGPGGFEVSTDLSVTEVPHVAAGAPATVVPDGDHKAYAGKVVSISALPSSVTSAATDYLVVVGLDDPNASLTNGDLGAVTIVTKRVEGALSVPTSAITAIGTRHVVQVLRSGRDPRTVAVVVGTVGTAWTQVTSGLRAGERVVLADLSTPLPGSATSSTNGTNGSATSRIQGLFRGAGGGFGGFGGFGGGAGGLGGGPGR